MFDGKLDRVVLALFGVFLLTNIFNAGLFSSVIMKPLDLSFVLNIVLLWTLLYHEKLDPGVLRRALIFFSMGYLVLVLVHHLGFSQTNIGSGRVSIGKALPNNLGINGVVAVCGLLVFSNSRNIPSILRSCFLVVLGLLIINLVLVTQSRSAFIALSVVLLIHLMHSKKRIQVLLLISCFFLFPVFTETFTVVIDRVISAIENGELGGRAAIYLTSMEIISSNYIFGVGRNGYDVLANLEFGFSPSPHNVFLEVLLYGGIIAEILWIFVIYKVLIMALQSYKNLKNYSGLILIIPFLINSIAGQIFNNTLMFLLIAMILSADVNRIKKVS